MKVQIYRQNSKLRKLGLSAEQFQTALAATGGMCRICKQPRRLVADLARDTRRFRGFICNACKTGLSMFQDSAANVAAALEYLQETSDDPQ